ncbi:MAG: response regulator [Ignavibacteriaceae bacterium]
MNIAIIENNKFYRESLRTVLNQIEDFIVVYDGDNSEGITQLLETGEIDIILIDYDIVEGNFSQIKEQILKLFPPIKIIVVSNYSEVCYSKNLISKGITDIISKNSGKNEFEELIRHSFSEKQLNFNVKT